MPSLTDLSPREAEILQLILVGKTNKAIASKIYISEKTVEFHLANLYDKIGVRTRILASVWAIRNGMEVPPREIPS